MISHFLNTGTVKLEAKEHSDGFLLLFKYLPGKPKSGSLDSSQSEILEYQELNSRTRKVDTKQITIRHKIAHETGY